MDPVSRLNRTLAALRQAGTSPRHVGTAGQGAGAPQTTSPRRGSVGKLRALIVRRLRTLDPSDPAQRDAGVRLFLEQVLLHEFGTELVNSPRFQQMVGEVFDAMNADAGLKAELDALVRQLAGER